MFTDAFISSWTDYYNFWKASAMSMECHTSGGRLLIGSSRKLFLTFSLGSVLGFLFSPVEPCCVGHKLGIFVLPTDQTACIFWPHPDGYSSLATHQFIQTWLHLCSMNICNFCFKGPTLHFTYLQARTGDIRTLWGILKALLGLCVCEQRHGSISSYPFFFFFYCK